MKRFLRILSVILCLCLLFVVVPLGTFTVSAATSGTTGDCEWQLNGSELTISGNGKMGDYSTAYLFLPDRYVTKAPWGYNITKIIIEKGVTQIGVNAFYGCRNIVTITLPDSVTYIAENAFRDCSNLENVDMPDSVLAYGNNAFADCPKLKNIGNRKYGSIDKLVWRIVDSQLKIYGEGDIPDYSTAYLFLPNRYVTKAPWGYDISEVIISDDIKKIGCNAFYGSKNLETVFLPSTITYIVNAAFGDCTGLTDVYYSGTQTQWRNINIEANNTPLINATIHYNSVFPGTETIQYGLDRFGFGEQVGGYVGDTVSTLLLYKSESYTTKNLSIRSTDNNIVEIARIDHGIGNYIAGENEHIATLYLKLKSEGKANIIVDSPDGSSGSYDITVHSHPMSIAVFSTERSLSVKTGEKMWVAFGLMNMDTGLVDDGWRKMTVTVSDPTIISLSDYEETEYGYSLQVTGQKEGSTNVVIADTATGLNKIISVSVQDNYVHTYSYDINNMPVFYPKNVFDYDVKTNIYDMNGLYVNNYTCKKTGDNYAVEFDAYNSKYFTGAVDIYDQNGLWIGYEEINKYTDIQSLWDTGEQAYYFVNDLCKGKIGAYTTAALSKKTHIKFSVPNGGYFTISNNVSTSPGTFFANSLEILFDGAFAAMDLLVSNKTKTTAFDGFRKGVKETLTQRLIEAHNESLKSEAKKQVYITLLSSMQSEINKITKKFSSAELKYRITSTDNMYSDMASLAENMLKSYNINWKHLFQSATGVGESIFVALSGPAGTALKGCFALNKDLNKLMMGFEMAISYKKTYATIYTSVDEGFINSNGVTVNTNGNVESEAVLQVFKISDNDTIEAVLDSNNPLEKYQTYNICFVKDDKQVQPNGKVKVFVPIPEGMNGNTCKIYRQESDGAWTILDAHIEENCLVFETNHFSYYAIVGDENELTVESMPDKTQYVTDDVLDTSGLVLKMNNELITEGFMCDPVVLTGTGTKTITAKYGCTSTTFDVEVKEPDYVIEGNIHSVGDKLGSYLIRLFKSGNLVDSIETNEDSYAFTVHSKGYYSLEVSEKGHAIHAYSLVVSGNVIKNVQLHILGDLNGDNAINAQDLVALRIVLLSDTDEFDGACDVNGDGIVDIRDLVRLKKYLALGTPIGGQNESSTNNSFINEIATLPDKKDIA